MEYGPDGMAEVTRTRIADVMVITPVRHLDARGSFTETWNSRDLATTAGIEPEFVQDNLAGSTAAGTVRGLHYQAPPMAQGKLVSVLKGAIFDVALDLRRDSPSYGRHVALTLSAEAGNQAWVPAGFAHGYCTLEDDTVVFYKQTDYWSPELEGGILWRDPALAIAWPVGPETAILSEKDRGLPTLAEWEAAG
jgi:dTDP-4-dehydrorhamnose 3,5-epimerase